MPRLSCTIYTVGFPAYGHVTDGTSLFDAVSRALDHWDHFGAPIPDDTILHVRLEPGEGKREYYVRVGRVREWMRATR